MLEISVGVDVVTLIQLDGVREVVDGITAQESMQAHAAEASM